MFHSFCLRNKETFLIIIKFHLVKRKKVNRVVSWVNRCLLISHAQDPSDAFWGCLLLAVMWVRGFWWTDVPEFLTSWWSFRCGSLCRRVSLQVKMMYCTFPVSGTPVQAEFMMTRVLGALPGCRRRFCVLYKVILGHLLICAGMEASSKQTSSEADISRWAGCFSAPPIVFTLVSSSPAPQEDLWSGQVSGGRMLRGHMVWYFYRNKR